MTMVLQNGRVLLPDGFRDGVSVRLAEGRIRAIDAAPETGDKVIDLAGKFLLPGFIDLQVNGGGGALFNDTPDVDTIRRIAATHRKFGTTGLLPTLISDDLDVVSAAIAAVDAAIEVGVPGILGIHLEGPFLNPARRGVHDATKFRILAAAEIELLSSLRRGKTLVTLAPDVVAPEQVRELAERGVIVAAGHTDASFSEVVAAIDAGLRGFTHLFNAMSPLQSREPGTVGAALAYDDCWCGVIVDGYHVHPASIGIALRCKQADKVVLVTDAMPGVGSDQDTFTLNGEVVCIVDGRCQTADGTLAGSNLDMAGAVRNACDSLGLNLAEAARLASRNPAAALGIPDAGDIRPGNRADLVALDEDLRVIATWIYGEMSPCS